MRRRISEGDLYSSREILGFRLLGIIAAMVALGMGVVHHVADSSVVDPFWERGLVAGACLGAAAVTFFDRGRWFRRTLYAIIAIVTAWIIHLVYLNDLSEGYGFGLLIVIATASMLIRDARWMGAYLGGVVAVVAVAGSVVSEPETSPLVFTAYVAIISLLLFVVLGSRLRTERDLAESEERYSLAADGSRDGLWDWDLERDRIHFSARWRELLGGRPDPTGGSPSEWFDRVHPEDRPALLRAVERIRDGDAEHLEHEYRMEDEDGGHRWVLTRGAAVRDGGGRAVRMAGSQTDVTERRLIGEELRQAQRLESIGRLAGGIAHDFNNLLTVITSHAQMALQDLPDTEESKGDVRAIYGAARQAAELTRQLLAFGRMQAVDLRLADLNAVVGRAATELDRLLEDRIELEIRLADGPWPVRIDPSQMERVVVDLALNARDAMPEGGRLVIETENLELGRNEVEWRSFEVEPGDYVSLRVTDTGVGMDTRTLAQVFDPFFTTKKREKGTGLGLATVFGAVKQNQGCIRAESSPGEGSTFTILLPRAVSGDSDPPRSPVTQR